ncbi:hypothetical protein D9756_004927 [Leucocoprinus leucothites]|uniref:Arrestin-like N-terminal domain-containing protein n=1 Tax=Leucocoprinus leucothites TaxID=201217 RepID=A0A8H5G918_9AGAR|nr:hypothetical protein D9756_004927 [Leucoagaricus leucothites]
MATLTDTELPEYADISRDTAIATSDSTNAPSVASSPYKSEFKTGLQDEAGYSWLLLRVQSRSPSAKNLPFFVEGDTISGVVELDATKTSSVKEVLVEIQAGATVVAQEEEIFLSLKETLWTSHAAGAGSSRKLKGLSKWSFNFILPKEVGVVGPHGRKGFYQLPPSFSERASPAYLDYRIVVKIRRGGLRVSQKLTTTFIYQPITFPGSSMSPLMKLASAEGSPLPNPKQDAEGWQVLPKLKLEGVLFGVRRVEVQCQLAIANPLEYALGSPLLLYLVIESEDEQALNVLTSPTAVRVDLVRAMSTGSDATAEKPERRSNNFFTSALSRGYFWGVDEAGCGPNRKVLHGEIDLEAKLKPTFVFPRLSIEYTVNFVGFEATGWATESQSSKGTTMLSEPVKVTSRQLAGSVTRSTAPPGYRKPEVDYNKSLGYLENGNQRFLHHGGFF